MIKLFVAAVIIYMTPMLDGSQSVRAKTLTVKRSKVTGVLLCNFWLRVHSGPSVYYRSFRNREIPCINRSRRRTRVLIYGQDLNTGWYLIKYGNTRGYVSNRHVKALARPPRIHGLLNNCYFVNVRTRPGSDSPIKTAVSCRDRSNRKRHIPILGIDADTGWYKVYVNGVIGWISPKILRPKQKLEDVLKLLVRLNKKLNQRDLPENCDTFAKSENVYFQEPLPGSAKKKKKKKKRKSKPKLNVGARAKKKQKSTAANAKPIRRRDQKKVNYVELIARDIARLEEKDRQKSTRSRKRKLYGADKKFDQYRPKYLKNSRYSLRGLSQEAAIRDVIREEGGYRGDGWFDPHGGSQGGVNGQNCHLFRNRYGRRYRRGQCIGKLTRAQIDWFWNRYYRRYQFLPNELKPLIFNSSAVSGPGNAAKSLNLALGLPGQMKITKKTRKKMRQMHLAGRTKEVARKYARREASRLMRKARRSRKFWGKILRTVVHNRVCYKYYQVYREWLSVCPRKRR